MNESDLYTFLLIFGNLSLPGLPGLFFSDFCEVTIRFLSLFFTLILLRLEAINHGIIVRVLGVSAVGPLRKELCQALLAHQTSSVARKIFVCSV